MFHFTKLFLLFINIYRKTEDGVLYFADDDNSYDARVFSEVRGTKSVSMLPVGLLRPAAVRWGINVKMFECVEEDSSLLDEILERELSPCE